MAGRENKIEIVPEKKNFRVRSKWAPLRFPCRKTLMTPKSGTLVLASTNTTPTRIGRLSRLRLQRGFYAYVGPVGPRARLAYHLRADP